MSVFVAKFARWDWETVGCKKSSEVVKLLPISEMSFYSRINDLIREISETLHRRYRCYSRIQETQLSFWAIRAMQYGTANDSHPCKCRSPEMRSGINTIHANALGRIQFSRGQENRRRARVFFEPAGRQRLTVRKSRQCVAGPSLI